MGNEQTGKEAWSADDERGREISPAPIATPEEAEPTAVQRAAGRLHGYAQYLDDGTGTVIDPYQADPDAPTRTEDIYTLLGDWEALVERSTSAAEIERLTRERDDAWAAAEAMSADVTDLGAKNTTLTAEVGRMRGLLDEAAGYLEGEGYYTEAGRYRAALSPEPEAKETHR